ncbi:hypothetical protein MHK_001855 [Candidatus Magnetomorum sp. HK-1]|nr:hypothetical protein MHK_001855 [Candidatus Magnetomorum sp. HK-1]
MSDNISIITQGDVNINKDHATATIIKDTSPNEYETVANTNKKESDSTKKQWLIAAVIIPVIATIVM